jgi:hypothetical protein
LTYIVILDCSVVQLLVVVVERSRVAALKHELLTILDSVEQLGFTLAQLSNFVKLFSMLKISLLLLAELFKLLLFESYGNLLSSGCETSLHHSELTLVFLLVGSR